MHGEPNGNLPSELEFKDRVRLANVIFRILLDSNTHVSVSDAGFLITPGLSENSYPVGTSQSRNQLP